MLDGGISAYAPEPFLLTGAKGLSLLSEHAG
jgi:hypothetical protein